MTTCALVSAANEPARFPTTAGARSRPARCGRSGDGTLDTPVSNVVPPLLAAARSSHGSGKLYREPGRHLTFLPLGFEVDPENRTRGVVGGEANPC